VKTRTAVTSSLIVLVTVVLIPVAAIGSCDDQEPVDDYIYTECCGEVRFCVLYWADHVSAPGINTYVMSASAKYWCDSECYMPECGGWDNWYIKYFPFNCY
jgi:hypothetical protein